MHVYVILRADGQLLQPAENQTDRSQKDQIHYGYIHSFIQSQAPGGDAAEDSAEITAAQREQNPTGWVPQLSCVLVSLTERVDEMTDLR